MLYDRGDKMRYMGSKNRISKELVPIIQSYITENTKGYIEPFVGGANVIDKIKCNKKIGYDIHKQLIALLNHVKETIEDVPETITEEEYNKVKNNKSHYSDWYIGLVGFCATFATKYFGGYARDKKENKDVPCGRIRNIKKQSINLKDIKFICQDYREIKDLKGYVIYCDPPYKNTTKYSTGKFSYNEFYKWCKEMSKDNIVLISEYSMPEGFKCIWKKETKVYFESNKIYNNNRIEKLYICE